MDKVSGDITKIMQACTIAEENTGKLIENAISQALTKPQDVMPPNPTIIVDHSEQTMHQLLKNKLDLILANNNFGLPQQSNNDVYHSQRPFETSTSPHAYVNQQPPPI